MSVLERIEKVLDRMSREYTKVIAHNLLLASKQQVDNKLAELERQIAEAPVVYGRRLSTGLWAFDEQPVEGDSHRARLVMIEELKGE